MPNNFIPSLHLIPSKDKLNPTWCREAINYYWYNSNVRSLLWNKRIAEIEEYASGNINMQPYVAMYKSKLKKLKEKMVQSRFLNEEPDVDDLIFQPLPLIQNKLNAAIALIQKVPLEITVTANDALAMSKRKQDLDFLKNKPELEDDLQDIADQLQIGKVDLGTTKNSSVKFSDNPFGLNLSNPDDQQTFMNLIYALNVETALEEALQSLHDLKQIVQLRLLETKDQYYYGVSCNIAYSSSMTGFPDAQYVYPGDVYTAPSLLPDHSDVDAQYWEHRMTINEMFNFVGDEICNAEMLERIINEKNFGYCACNNISNRIDERNFNSTKVSLLFCAIKSVDWVGVYKNPKSKRGTTVFTDDEKKCTDKIWGQNTYCFWWLKNTKYFFKIEVLPYAHRTKGLESYQNFPISIYRSNNKSPVELSIAQNKKAQSAEIKMNYAVVMAKADGILIDLHGIRNAADGLKDSSYTKEDLISLALERNVVIIDTDGFEGKNDGQFKPIIPIQGGISNIVNYLNIIASADQKINQFMNTNDSLTGISDNPDALIGVEKLRINASTNGQYHINQAIQTQYQKLFTILSNQVQYSIKAGGKTKEGMINYIGKDDVDFIEGMNEVPIHNLTCKITLGQREEERAAYQARVNFLISKGAMTLAEEYILSAITNPKRKFAELAKIENRYRIREDKIRQENFANAQAIQEQRNNGAIAEVAAKIEGDKEKIYTQGEVDAKIMQLGGDLGMNQAQIQGLIKKALQQDRGQDQLRKALATQNAKNESKQIAPLPIV